MSYPSQTPSAHDDEHHEDIPCPKRRGTGIFIWSSILDFSTRLSTILFVAALCTVVIVTCIPQRKAVAQLVRELDVQEAQKSQTLDYKELTAQKLHALRTDPSFLEIQARDRLDYYLPGETIVRIRRPE